MKKILVILMTLMLLFTVMLVPTLALAATEEQPGPVVINWVNILAIAEAAAVILFGMLVSYFKTSAVFRGFVAQLIADAEVKYANAEKAGSLKMAWVIDSLYKFVPLPLRTIFTRERLERLAQDVFDQIALYAKIQIDKAVTALQAKYNAAKK